MKVGDVVTFTVEYAAGTETYVKNEIGIITEYSSEDNIFEVTTGNPYTTKLWYEEGELRLATDEEIKNGLRYLLIGK